MVGWCCDLDCRIWELLGLELLITLVLYCRYLIGSLISGWYVEFL